jgi:hypothetical protein
VDCGITSGRKAERIGGKNEMKYKVSKSNAHETIEVGEFANLDEAKAVCRAAADRDYDASVHLGMRLVYGANLTNDWKDIVASNADGTEFSEQEIQSKLESGW